MNLKLFQDYELDYSPFIYFLYIYIYKHIVDSFQDWD